MEKFQRHNNQFATDRDSIGKDSDDQYTAHSSPRDSSFQEGDSPKPDSEDGERLMMSSPPNAPSSGGKSDNDSDASRDHNDDISSMKASQSALIAQQLQLAAAFAQQRASSGGSDGNMPPSLSSFMPQAMMSQFHQFHNGFDQSQLQHVSFFVPNLAIFKPIASRDCQYIHSHEYKFSSNLWPWLNALPGIGKTTIYVVWETSVCFSLLSFRDSVN